MSGRIGTTERAKELGRLSGKARKVKAERLTLERVEAELGPLETVEDAMCRLDRLGLWITAGMLSGSAGGAAVRSVEVWLRGHESQLSRELVEGLRGRLDELEAQVKRSRLGVV